MSAADTHRLLRGFHRPRLWLAVGVAAVLALVAVSLLPARNLPPSPFSGFDKLGHLVAYAALSAYAVMLFARMRAQALAAMVLIALGIVLEIGQGALAGARDADSADALANALGVLLGLLASATPLARWLQKLDTRLGPPRTAYR